MSSEETNDEYTAYFGDDWIERMDKALKGKTYRAPEGLTREQRRLFLTGKDFEYKGEIVNIKNFEVG